MMRRNLMLVGQVAVLSVVLSIFLWYYDLLLVNNFSAVTRKLDSGEAKTDTVDFNPSDDAVEGITVVFETDDDDDDGDGEDDDVRANEASEDEDEATLDELLDAPPKQHVLENTVDYVQAILDADDTTFQRLECPTPGNLARYEALKLSSTAPVKYFFALDLTQCVDLLPRLLGTVVETLRFLGPENCAVSVVEGNSDDGTGEVLEAIRTEIEALGTEYFFETSDVDPKQGDRIVGLAALRNAALQPMLDDKRQYSDDTTIIFINDVAICMDDILELVYQRTVLGADMTCAMDWTHVGPHPTFYDVWISRTMAGDSFFNIPESGSWDLAWSLFWNDPQTNRRYNAKLPFQVFSCWNGAVAFTAAPILKEEIAFRAPNDKECYQGEPQLLCKDMWHKGYGKLAVIPTVNLEYTDEKGTAIKQLKGYTSTWTALENETEMSIDWQLTPPDQVKCMSSMSHPTWGPWNETIV